jgi:hypothetical protein
LWENPEDLTQRQAAKLAWVAKANAALYRAYLLKEQLRIVFQLKDVRGIALLGKWLAWASRCRIPAFVELARSIRYHRGHRGRPHPRVVQRPGGVGQHQDPATAAHRLRLPGPRRLDRHGDVRSRRLLPELPSAHHDRRLLLLTPP